MSLHTVNVNFLSSNKLPSRTMLGLPKSNVLPSMMPTNFEIGISYHAKEALLKEHGLFV